MRVHGHATHFLADDERDLAVDLQVRQTIGHVHAGTFQLPRPFDVVGFVEASRELHEHRDLLPTTGGIDERFEMGESGRSIHRLR